MISEKLIFITGNQNKLREAQEILGRELTGMNLDVPEIQAIEPREVIETKLDFAFAQAGKPLFVEDTGFHIEEMGGFPGALIKWLLQGLEGERVCRFLDLTKNRKVEVKSVIGWTDGKEKEFFVGSLKGTIAQCPRGENGFEFDKYFIPEGKERTVAEMSPEEKNAVSWRGQAFAKFKDFLKLKNG